MDIRGKIVGYDKKVLLISLVTLSGAFIFFLAGTKFERYKLTSLGRICPSPSTESEFRAFLESYEGKTLTLRMENGAEKKIQYNNATKFGDSKKDTLKDLSIGQFLLISGKDNPDGTFTPMLIRKSKRIPKEIPPELQADNTSPENPAP